MKENETSPGTYVDKVREDTGRYVRQLLQEHESLRVAFAQLETENARAREEVSSLRQDLDARRKEEETLHEKVMAIRSESEDYMRRYSELESSNTNLANLYVASYQLHGTLDRQAVLDAIQEIVVNLVGSEQFAVLEGNASSLSLACSVGLDDLTIHRSREKDAQLWSDALAGRPYVRSDETAEGMVACIPLKLDNEVTGVIAIFALLPHKPGLEPLDHELLDLLATHAATALYCTSLHERCAAVPK
ncbi:MAG TPA: GAF domain-containing protein [Thermoanaerobaculia bacterium]|nr:GAF domain-containing protein [Thermoanaerobaculia bacterium]